MQGGSRRKGGAFLQSSAAEPLLSDLDAAVGVCLRRVTATRYNPPQWTRPKQETTRKSFSFNAGV